MMGNIRQHLPYLTAFCFFLLSLFTVYDYGMNWDSAVHFARGQAYLRFILTGKTDYRDNPPFCRGKYGFNARVDVATGEVCDRHRKERVSEFESTLLDFNWARKDTYGHPAFSDMMLALANQLFFKRLGLVEDVQAYHIYPIFMTFILAVVVAYWAKITYGNFASLISVISLYSFPLLFGEQHFNIKDPPMAAFFTLGIFFFWLSFARQKSKYLLLSAVFGGMSFSTKINFIFAPVILMPWFCLYLGSYLRQLLKKIPFVAIVRKLSLRFVSALFFYPFIIVLIFFLSWPAMWFDTQKNLFRLLQFYQDVGVSQCPYARFTLQWITQCSDTLTVKYLLFTLPIVTLLFFMVGVFVGIRRYKEYHMVSVLWLSFFFVTLLRVTFAISSVYGGLRQILEFIAPLALLSGVGALTLRDFSLAFISRFIHPKSQQHLKLIFSLSIILAFFPIILVLFRMHPYENIFFNELIGGVYGAYKKNFPGNGNTYGNTYYQGVLWLNSHAIPNSKLALVTGLGQNISRSTLREDILFHNTYLSAYNQDGEYQMTQIIQGDPHRSTFSYLFAEKFLEPVYVISYDGVELFKLWKNDARHIKRGLDIHNEKEEKVDTKIDGENLSIRFNKIEKLKRLEFFFQNDKCDIPLSFAKIFLSIDDKEYQQVPQVANDFTENEIRGYKAKRIVLFTGEEAKYITISFPPHKECAIEDLSAKAFTFVNLGM